MPQTMVTCSSIVSSQANSQQLALQFLHHTGSPRKARRQRSNHIESLNAGIESRSEERIEQSVQDRKLTGFPPQTEGSRIEHGKPSGIEQTQIPGRPEPPVKSDWWTTDSSQSEHEVQRRL